MQRRVGTVVRGIRLPIVRRGDAIEDLVADAVLQAAKTDCFAIRDRDVIGVTESIVARAQGNYASVDQIASNLKAMFSGDCLGVIFPILSRNRFAILLKAIARSTKRVVLQFSYPADEVGNQLLDPDLLDQHGVNPWTDQFTEDSFKRIFGQSLHPFTGVDYVQYYRSLVEGEKADCIIIFANNPRAVLAHTRNVLACDIHARSRTKRHLAEAGAERVHGLDEVLRAPVNGSGYHPEFGLLGSNKANEDTVKLFPRDCHLVVNRIQKLIRARTGKTVEAMVYGDGAFKDPVGKIWELADPVVSPGYTAGLEGTPNELKLKYLADSQFADLSGQALHEAIVDRIRSKKSNLVGVMDSQGTTPRRLTDLLGSLCDLTSGSGDKGTPVIHIQGYFDNLATG